MPAERARRPRDVPTSVPVVPSPATKWVMPGRSARISGPVPSSCARQLLGFEIRARLSQSLEHCRLGLEHGFDLAPHDDRAIRSVGRQVGHQRMNNFYGMALGAIQPAWILPCALDRFQLQGVIAEEDLESASTGPDPSPAALGGPAAIQVATYPLYLTVIGFP